MACEKTSSINTVPRSPLHSLQWVQLFGGSQEDIAHDVIATQDGGFAVIGNTKSIDGDVQDKSVEVADIIVLKYSSNAELQLFLIPI